VTAVSPVVCHTIHTFETVDSTQAVLGRLAANGAPEGTVIAARHQTAGRGSRGKQWWDAPGESLMFSALLRPGVPIARAPQLSLVSGVGVVDALHTCCDVDARIRWPNDVLIEGKKVCGVLPEAVSHADGRVNYVLLGIGINVHQREFPLELRDTATSLLLATGVMHDQRVRMRDGSEGLAVDVDDTGALLVDTGRGALTRVVSAVADPGEKSA
jgi:BirA family transcriptional regulator, biotin operon repressor / biotin---[acetyl-CoA-carboxylase] ligase